MSSVILVGTPYAKGTVSSFTFKPFFKIPSTAATSAKADATEVLLLQQSSQLVGFSSPMCIRKALSPVSGGQLFGCMRMVSSVRALSAGDLGQSGFPALVGWGGLCVCDSLLYEW